MAGCVHSLANNPDVQDKLRKEVQEVMGQDPLVTPRHIQDMPYLRDTIKETMRYNICMLASEGCAFPSFPLHNGRSNR